MGPADECVHPTFISCCHSISLSGLSSAKKRHTKRIRRHLSPRHIDNKHIHHPIIKRQREGRGVGDKEDSLLFSLHRHQSSNGPSVFLASISLHARFKDITADPEREASRCNTEPPLSSICWDRVLLAHGALLHCSQPYLHGE